MQQIAQRVGNQIARRDFRRDDQHRLYTAPYPNPDLIVPHQRGTLVEQFPAVAGLYAELWFPEVLARLLEEEFDRAMEEYARRDRRLPDWLNR